LSPNGSYLTATGYNAPVGTSSVSGTASATMPRTVAVVGTTGAVNTTTSLTTFADGTNPRSATTVDGTHVWVGGAAGGIQYAAVGASTGTTITNSTYKNVRQVSVFNNQLYTSADPTKASVTVATVGSGLPTSGSLTPANLAFASPPTGPYAYSLLTLGTGTAPDTMYVADNSAGAIVKYSLSGSSWVSKGSVSVAAVTGVTANDVNGVVSIFATSSGASSTAGTLYSITDSGGTAGNLSGSATLIATAPSKETFRGVAFAPGTTIGSGGTVTTPPSVPTLTPAHTGLPATLGDPTNATLPITVGDNLYDPTQLSLTATSSNTTVAPTAGISLSGTGATRTLTVTPGAVGYSTITLKATAPDASTTSTTISYAVSANLGDSSDRYYAGAGNFSTAIEVGGGYLIAGDDESNILRLYQEGQSGDPVKTFDFTSVVPAGTTEIDIEASARVGNTIYWTGSMSNSNSGDLAPTRNTLFAATISGSGASTTLTYQGSYSGIRADMIAWDQNNGHGLGANKLGLAASAASGLGGHESDAFDVEGMEFAAGSSTTAYIAFRAPLQSTSSRTQALVVPVTNLAALTANGNPGTTKATFGAPMFWNLGGLGIRDIRMNADGQYLVLAGTADGTNNSFKLYTWDGNVTHQPLASSTALPLIPAGDSQGSWETIVNVPDPLIAGAAVQLVEDNGDTVWYNDGLTSKTGLITDVQKDLGRTFSFLAPVVPASTTALTASTTMSSIGQSIVYTATVGGAGGQTGTATGPVTFYDGSAAIPACTAVALNAAGVATCTMSYPAAAQHLIKAVYAGDNAFAGSTSTVLTESVQPWTLTITADNQSRTFGQPDPTFSSTTGGLMGSDALSTAPTCVVAPAHSAVGSYPITCSGADAGPNYTINYVAGTLNVTKAPVTVTATANQNPTVTGNQLILTATVASVGVSPNATGTVRFASNGATLGGCGSVTLSGGAGTCVLSNGLPAGSYPIDLTYTGDDSFAAGASAPNLLIVQVNPAATTTALTSDVTSAVSGQPVTFTASVDVVAPGAGQPSGSVEFQADGINLPGCAAQSVSTAGEAVCPVSAGFRPSEHTITAAYNGDANFTSSTAAPLDQAVSVAATTTAVSTSTDAPIVGTPYTATALITVTAPGSGAPSGTVSFANTAGAISSCSAVTVSAIAPYTAACTATETSLGADSISATYSGDSSFAGSNGSHQVGATNGPATALVLSPTNSSIAAGGFQTYTATATDANGNDLGAVMASTTLTIAPDGTCTEDRCTAAIPGSHTVTATDGAASATATLVISTTPTSSVPRDVVGVGDGLSQFGLDFLTNGDTSGDPGFNTSSGLKHVDSFDATADASGRTIDDADGTPMNTTVVLNPGTNPIARPNSSRVGLDTLLNDTGSDDVNRVQFVRSTLLPTAADQTAAGARGWGGLRVIQYASDSVQIAVSSTATNAPSGLSVAELVKIYDGTYQTWGQLPGYTGAGGSEEILAKLPPAGSDLRRIFDATLAAANGGHPVGYASSVLIVGEDDYTAITGSDAPQDVIVPFSTGFLSLVAQGYFNAGDDAPTVVGLTGTAPDDAAAYTQSVPLYVIFRDQDVSTSASWQPGSRLNWVHALFIGPNSLVTAPAYRLLLPAAGLTAEYADLGDAHQ
ncbi:MAG: hypothetical protein JWO63_2295, partial [Frankiales bacterium]|nr:hypothetical protein [Frankiales bacterium]